MKTKIIVIGNGMVGYKFCERLVEKDTNNQFQIIAFCEEPRPAYDRVQLSKYFSGTTADELLLAQVDWYSDNGVELHIGDKAHKVDLASKTVYSEQGRELKYDKLIFATGSSPFVPPVPGIDKAGVFVYRTIEDLDATIAYGKKAKTCAVIGGGLLGLEAAKAAQDMGAETHVVEFAPRLMPRQLDEVGGEVLKNIIESRGIKVHLNKATKNIAGDGKVEKMEFADTSSLDVDMIVISAGIRPRDEVAKEAGLVIGERGGILVDDYLKTSDPDVYAIGECALYNKMIYGLVAPGYQMADVVAEQLVGREASFTGADMSTKLKLIGTDVASFGNIEPQIPHKNITINDPIAGIYKNLFISEDGEKLLGGILVGDADAYGTLLQMYQNDMKLPAEPIQLILPAGDGAAPVGTNILDLPDTAQICSCENVSKGDICQVIDDGAQSLSDIKSATKACTGCGGCTQLVTDLFKAKLKEAGIEVNNNVCEHFDMTRQEMYQTIRVTGIQTYKEFLNSHGKGTEGCEICKPAVASILASTWNRPILEQPHILDSNDAFLANIQKDGTYSVIPRIPGGELTPDQLIVIGEVGKKYALYTKITGGQRIDLLGAKLKDLPDIWRELIAAGFESGHAYAKSLRTIKSCVGSTWCRYGVQDSTSLAIKLELRYRGLRSPHKLKSAVSGCTRECAEAQSKDFGIIATEKGWNLYVCGNGGIKPRHADLLVSDIDEETLIKYIDRFLMYYIKTADKLMRTSTWMDQLEGGIEHLKDVVINDSLGLNAELESQMEHLVDTYECEWQNTLADPVKLKRFNHFVNTDDEDETVAFAQQREQIRPINDEERIIKQ